MIHTLLELTRPLFIFDTETTGTNPTKDRIIEFGFQQWTSEGMVKEWRSLINPGIPIPAASIRVHGITDKMVNGCKHCGYQKEEHPTKECDEFSPWPRFSQIATNLAGGFTDCDFGGQNIRFDLRITYEELVRARVRWSYAEARIIDTARLESIITPRSLSALHEKYVGHPHDDAHGALSDVSACVKVLEMQLRTYPLIPRDLDKLHDLQWPNFIDPEGKFVYVDGVAHFSGWGKYAGKPITAADNGYWDFILANSFSPEVKKIAADAKLKKYPTKG